MIFSPESSSNPLDDEIQQTPMLKSSQSPFDITPDWENSSSMYVDGVHYIEVPLLGEVYNEATVKTQRRLEGSDSLVLETKTLVNKSFLYIQENVAVKATAYFVVNVSAYDNDLADFRFLGNDFAGIDGFVIISDLEGHCKYAYRVHNQRRQPILIAFENQYMNSVEFSSIRLDNSSYRIKTKSGGSGNGYNYCLICGKLLKGYCTNPACESLVIRPKKPGEWTGGGGSWREDNRGEGDDREGKKEKDSEDITDEEDCSKQEGGNSGNSASTSDSSKICEDINNKLKDDDKKKLEAIIDKLKGNCGYETLFYYLEESGLKLNGIGMKSDLTDPAQYNPQNKTVYFRNSAAINPTTFGEEFLHFFQDCFYSGGTGQYGGKADMNIEFEAKFIVDILCIKGNGACIALGANWAGDSSAYSTWVNEVANLNRFPSFSEIREKYFFFMKEKQKDVGYSNCKINIDLTPKTLDYLRGNACNF